jgi:hypothetical protein
MESAFEKSTIPQELFLWLWLLLLLMLLLCHSRKDAFLIAKRQGVGKGLKGWGKMKSEPGVMS